MNGRDLAALEARVGAAAPGTAEWTHITTAAGELSIAAQADVGLVAELAVVRGGSLVLAAERVSLGAVHDRAGGWAAALRVTPTLGGRTDAERVLAGMRALPSAEATGEEEVVRVVLPYAELTVRLPLDGDPGGYVRRVRVEAPQERDPRLTRAEWLLLAAVEEARRPYPRAPLPAVDARQRRLLRLGEDLVNRVGFDWAARELAQLLHLPPLAPAGEELDLVVLGRLLAEIRRRRAAGAPDPWRSASRGGNRRQEVRLGVHRFPGGHLALREAGDVGAGRLRWLVGGQEPFRAAEVAVGARTLEWVLWACAGMEQLAARPVPELRALVVLGLLHRRPIEQLVGEAVSALEALVHGEGPVAPAAARVVGQRPFGRR